MRFLISALLIAVSGTLIAQTLPSPVKKQLRLITPAELQSKNKEVNTALRQRSCFTDEHTRNLQQQSSNYLSVPDFENRLEKLIVDERAARTAEDLLKIPVIVHVVHNGEAIGTGANISQAQVLSQIDVLNEDFRRTGPGANSHADGADTNIEFVPAVIGPDGQELEEPGIRRVNGGAAFWDYSSIESQLKVETIWDPEKYFNIWTVEFSEEDDLLGYAQFPNFSDLPGLDKSDGVAETDGVVIGYQYFGRTGNVVAPFDGGRTATHEVGHWLGLRHIWGDGDCTTDDYCSDTPNAGQPNYSCQQVNSCNDGEGDALDMVENYMDYTDDACMNIFTNEQKERMRTVLANSPRRKELVQSNVGEASDKPIANFEMSITSGCAGQEIEFTDRSTNNPTSWTWNFYAGEQFLAEFQGETVVINFNGAGVYSVELIAENSAGSNTVLIENVITIYEDATVDVLHEDMENIDHEDFFEGWVVVNPDADRGWQISDESAYNNGSFSLTFDNYSADSDPSGTRDILVSPPINLNGAGEPYLSFDHSYAIYTQGYVDTLKVLYSLDCGVTWSTLWAKGGNELATSAPTEDPFFPESDEWQTNEISLSQLLGESSVHIAFVNASGWGNLLYLDNISFNYLQVSQAVESQFSTEKVKICENDVIQYNDQSLHTPSQWAWTFEGASPASSGKQFPKVSYDIAGVYDVTLTASNSMGGNTETKVDYIEVIAMPVMSVSGPEVACPGDEITLIASGGENIKWLSRGSVIFEGSTYTFKLQENLDLHIIGENELGCTGFVNHSILVSEALNLIASADSEGICGPGDVTLTAEGGSSYEWKIGEELVSNSASFSVALDETTTFTLIGYTETGDCSSETTVTVELYNVTIPEISFASGTMTCTEAASYKWYLNEQEIINATQRSYTPVQGGSYTVEVIDNNGCSAVSSAYIYEITSVEDLEERSLKIYPNPAKDAIHVNGSSGIFTFRIMDRAGKTVISGTVDSVSDFKEIAVDKLKEGIYLLTITDDTGFTTTGKFLKQ